MYCKSLGCRLARSSEKSGSFKKLDRQTRA